LQKKTILFTNVGADLYGADYVLLCLVKSLDRNRFSSIVIVPYDGLLVAELRKAGAEVIVREFPVLRRGVFTPLGLIRFAWQTVSSVVFLSGLTKSNNVDIFHTNTASLWAPGLAAAITRKPHIWQIMELVEQPRLVRWAMSKMTAVFSTRVFCISDAVRNHFLEGNARYAPKFQTLYHGVDQGEYDPSATGDPQLRERLGISEEALVVLYAGRFSEWKGQDVMAASARILCDRGLARRFDMHFIFLGSCFPGYEHCRTDLAAELGKLLEPRRAHLDGFQRNLPDWMKVADVFVLPSKRPEPNATVLIAAMTMGLPCIGTNIGGTVETIDQGKTGLLVPPDDPEALSEAIAHLASDASLRESMGLQGRLRARELFSVDKYCRAIIAAYDEL
jgi:glycosyltransferase involved in cell wall biosynthesis